MTMWPGDEELLTEHEQAMTTELLCPWCGEPVTHEHSWNLLSGARDRWVAYCDNRKCVRQPELRLDGYKELIEAWKRLKTRA